MWNFDINPHVGYVQGYKKNNQTDDNQPFVKHNISLMKDKCSKLNKIDLNNASVVVLSLIFIFFCYEYSVRYVIVTNT